MNQPEAKQTAILLRQSLQNGRYAQLTVTSNSMAPLLRKGDEVLITASAVSQLQPGDIITIETQTNYLTHRFWGLFGAGNEQWLHTRGSKPLAFDPPLATDSLVGRVIARRRGNKQLDLDTGWGNRLNRHLSRWNAWENRFAVDAKTPATNLLLWQQFMKWALYVWAMVVTAVTDLIAAKPIPTPYV